MTTNNTWAKLGSSLREVVTQSEQALTRTYRDLLWNALYAADIDQENPLFAQCQALEAGTEMMMRASSGALGPQVRRAANELRVAGDFFLAWSSINNDLEETEEPEDERDPWGEFFEAVEDMRPQPPSDALALLEEFRDAAESQSEDGVERNPVGLSANGTAIGSWPFVIAAEHVARAAVVNEALAQLRERTGLHASVLPDPAVLPTEDPDTFTALQRTPAAEALHTIVDWLNELEDYVQIVVRAGIHRFPRSAD